VSFDTVDGIFEGDVRIYVQDTTHLEELMRKLEKVEGVFNMTRFDCPKPK